MEGKTTKPTISMIAAIGKKDRSIGKDNALMWHVPADQKYFREVTKGHPVIMGRKTYESIPEQYRPLPGRPNIIVTRQDEYSVPEGVFVTDSLESAIDKAKETDNEEVFIIGGQQIYEQGLQYTDKLYITIIDTEMTGDTFFPEYEQDFTKETFREAGTSNGFDYTIVNLERTS